MLSFRKDPADIARTMTGRVTDRHAVLGSPRVQNHAAFLARSPQGQLNCVWFGGSLEGKVDICIFAVGWQAKLGPNRPPLQCPTTTLPSP